MGVYYYFFNERTGERNEKPLLNTNCTHVAKLNSIDDEYVLKAFRNVIEINGWNSADGILSCADYPGFPSLKFNNGKIEYIESEEMDYN
jgi:hypothetical protein